MTFHSDKINASGDFFQLLERSGYSLQNSLLNKTVDAKFHTLKVCYLHITPTGSY